MVVHLTFRQAAELLFASGNGYADGDLYPGDHKAEKIYLRAVEQIKAAMEREQSKNKIR